MCLFFSSIEQYVFGIPYISSFLQWWWGRDDYHIHLKVLLGQGQLLKALPNKLSGFALFWSKIWGCCSVNYDSASTGGGTSRVCCKLVKIVMSLLSCSSLLIVDICFKTLNTNVLCTLTPNWKCTCEFACDFIMLKGWSIWIKHDNGFPFRMPC